MTIKNVYSLYTFRFCSLDMVQIDVDVVWPPEKAKSGQPAKPKTARQQWTLRNFQFLSAHLYIWTDTSQLGRVPVPALQLDPEE